jgi:hypothetical protein
MNIASVFPPTIVIYTISGIKAILQDSSVKIADDEGVSTGRIALLHSVE